MQESLTTPHSGTKNPAPVSPLRVINDFEAVVFAKYPTLRKIKEKLSQDGAAAAAMSGSGSSLFGLFRNKDVAKSAARSLEESGIKNFMMSCSQDNESGR